MTDDPDVPNAEAEMGDEDRLQAFIDDELDAAAQAAFAKRIEGDALLAGRAADYTRTKRQLVAALAAATADPGDPYTATLTDGLARRMAPPVRFRWLRRLAMAAALLTAGWWGHDLVISVSDPVPDQVADAAQLHELFAQDALYPVELSAAESGALTTWMSRQLGEPITIPNLSAVGLTFLGGRLLGNEEGPFAQLLYQASDGARVSVYLARRIEDADESVQIIQIDGLNAGYWRQDDLAYAVVAAVPDEELLTIASRLGAGGPL